MVEAVIIAVAFGIAGAVAGDIGVETDLVRCSELGCLEPPLIGGLGGLIVGTVVGVAVAVRGRGRPLFRSARWALPAGVAAVLACVYLARSR